MPCYVIGYDLNQPGQDYEELYEQIKSYGTWLHHLDSTWFVKTNHTSAQIRNYLQQFIDDNDKLLVAELSGVAAWTGLNDKGTTWLKNNLSG